MIVIDMDSPLIDLEMIYVIQLCRRWPNWWRKHGVKFV